MKASIHSYTVEGIDGKEIKFADFAGKKIMIVNVASECGYTVQYQQLQELFNTFHNKIVIVGFPANDFGGQEPGTNASIQEFCSVRYGVKFPMTSKIAIKGDDVHPIYKWLTTKALNGVLDSEVKWNFHKYLLDEQGHLVATHPSSCSPIDEKIIDWVNS